MKIKIKERTIIWGENFFTVYFSCNFNIQSIILKDTAVMPFGFDE